MVTHVEGTPARSFLGRRLLVVGGLLVIVVLSGFVRSFIEFSEQDRRLEAFRPLVAGWVALASAPRSAEGPVTRGRVAMVDEDQAVMHDWAHGQLPPALRPDTPEQVGTVALCRSEWRHVGYYEDRQSGERSGEAWQGVLHVTLVDPAAGQVLAQRTFEGAEPVSQKRAEGDADGGLPYFDALEWIEGLPRR